MRITIEIDTSGDAFQDNGFSDGFLREYERCLDHSFMAVKAWVASEFRPTDVAGFEARLYDSNGHRCGFTRMMGSK